MSLQRGHRRETRDLVDDVRVESEGQRRYTVGLLTGKRGVDAFFRFHDVSIRLPGSEHLNIREPVAFFPASVNLLIIYRRCPVDLSEVSREDTQGDG
jgi:hypothetical protein